MVREGLSEEMIFKLRPGLYKSQAYKELGGDEMFRDVAKGQIVELGERVANMIYVLPLKHHSGCCVENRL